MFAGAVRAYAELIREVKCADENHLREWFDTMENETEDGSYLADIMDIALPWEVE